MSTAAGLVTRQDWTAQAAQGSRPNQSTDGDRRRLTIEYRGRSTTRPTLSAAPNQTVPGDVLRTRDEWPERQPKTEPRSTQGGDMRLYRAICAWLEASARLMDEPDEYHPEGAGEARSEHAYAYSAPPELHVRSNHEPAYDDEDRARPRWPIGFTAR